MRRSEDPLTAQGVDNLRRDLNRLIPIHPKNPASIKGHKLITPSNRLLTRTHPSTKASFILCTNVGSGSATAAASKTW
jgi:hypothetical protein